MIRTSIRVASAIAGVLVLVFGLSVIRHDLRQGAASLLGSILLFAPLFASRRMPSVDDEQLLAAGANRFRIAAMICFTFAGLTWMAVMTMGGSHGMANSIAALGVAWWIVGFALTPVAAYYYSRLAMIASDE
ncbi:MAG: hypothetical protein QOE82_1297 [Thermoanaerobaculia bacterium]|jgi:hypothetical protein|nr:hypothetical protein [Thermoanaerobaculia bacterium]